MVELISINKDENTKTSYPGCIRSEGIAPSQYGTKGLISEKLAEIEEKYDLNPEAMLTGFGEEGETETTGEEEEEESTEETGTQEI